MCVEVDTICNVMQVRSRCSPPSNSIDLETDEDIHACLTPYSVEYLEDVGEEGLCLCMARTDLPGGFTVASYGQGRSLAEAKREASIHLIQNINQLN